MASLIETIFVTRMGLEPSVENQQVRGDSETAGKWEVNVFA